MNILNIIYMNAYCILVVVVVLIIFLTVITNKKGPKSCWVPLPKELVQEQTKVHTNLSET